MIRTTNKKPVLVLISLLLCCGAFAQNVTKTFKNEPLVNVLKEVGNQTGYSFMYEASDLRNASTVTADFKDAKISKGVMKVKLPKNSIVTLTLM